MTEELKEKIIWQNINSSKEKGKILTGKIVAIEVEKMGEDNIICAIVDFKGIRVIIPTTEMIIDGKNEKNIIRNMMGAEIKFIVIETDEKTSKAIGSRLKAMQRLKEINLRRLQVGNKIYGKVIGVWKKYIRLECVGIDFLINAKNLQYGYIEDVSKKYKINEQIKVVVKEISEEKQSMEISVKDLLEDPFVNVRKNFVEKGEYLAKITGYTKNGIFANIDQGVDTVCTLPTWLDRPPFLGEKVIVKIYKILPERRKIYSSIIKVIGSDASD